MTKTLPSQYRLVTTNDGSPTLEFSGGIESENMHNFHGAFSETNYIYGEALVQCHHRNWPLRVLSVGLGLGYNEVMSAAFAEKTQVELHVISYEQEPILRSCFQSWIEGTEVTPLSKAYEQILQLYAQLYQVSAEEVLARLRKMIRLGQLELRGQFEVGSEPQNPPCHVLFYDPFSSKTNPEFWSQEAIEAVLNSWAAKGCVLSTYAATGALKRALKNSGFTVSVRKGFGGKRQSFLAVKDDSCL